MAKNKPWAAKARPVKPGGRTRRKVLILCEDTKSSVFYLRAFPVDKERVEVAVVGTGMNTDSLVEEAGRRVTADKALGVRYSDVWCVFDRDSFPERNYARAFELARAKAFKVAWANEAFELWYVLHFDYVTTGLARAQYKGKLKSRGLEYDKADAGIFEKLAGRQGTALKNARKLEAHWQELGERFPERKNPSTAVHQLVELLNELAALPAVT